MDTKPIIARIEADAREAVSDVLKEVEDQVLNIHEQSDLRLSQLKEETLRKAREESLRLEERMQRLSELNFRVELLQEKRNLIDKAFDNALETLRSLPEERFTKWLLKQLENAQGNEEVRAGAINDAFYGPAFLKKANDHLKALGKPGELKDAGGRVPGVSGLVLYGHGNEVNCTFEMAMEQARMDLEARLAQVLFDE